MSARTASLDEVFAVMSAASLGSSTARVAIPDQADLSDPATRVAIALNILLDDLGARERESQELAAQQNALAKAAATLAAEAARRQVEARDSEGRYRVMFDESPLPKWMYDLETLRFLEVNQAAIRLYGYTREEFLAMTLKEIRPAEEVPRLLALMAGVPHQPSAMEAGVWRHLKKDGTAILMEITRHALSLNGRQCGLAVGRDVTQRTLLEEQLRRAQKMEAVGRLAGGVAHDFNNLLSVVLSYGQMALDSVGPGNALREDLEEIVNAGHRAADLTRQLLMFSRQQAVDAQVMDLNEVLSRADKMLGRILGEDVELASVARPGLGKVLVDPGSIEQVLMNLVVNARDAMPTGGKITIETDRVDLDEDYARRHPGARPGPHVMLAVTDTGMGMDRATQARVFEPFFTTKEPGRGTGLGLSTVFGIVQRSGGSIEVYSELSKGSTFKVYLPRVEATGDQLRIESPPQMLQGTETILLVEDDEQVRAATMDILRRHGYHVIAARQAGEALLLSEKHPTRIHLMLTDVVMPGLSGPELAKRITARRPEMRVLCMSGYTDETVVRHGIIDSGLAYLQKPITPESLTRKVRAVLDAPPL